MPGDVCSICNGDFDLDAEGGAEGYIGILPVQFCPTCKAGIFDFAEQMRMPWECPNCGFFEDDDMQDKQQVMERIEALEKDGNDVQGKLRELLAENIILQDFLGQVMLVGEPGYGEGYLRRCIEQCRLRLRNMGL